jgi:5-methyltetrahydrofolate--homocysteine methyltransferase
MKPHLQSLARVSDVMISCYPNAGLPNAFGGYDETPAMFASDLAVFAKDGLLNIAGGCCGTSPDHIREMVKRVAVEKPRVSPHPGLSRVRGDERTDCISPASSHSM